VDGIERVSRRSASGEGLCEGFLVKVVAPQCDLPLADHEQPCDIELDPTAVVQREIVFALSAIGGDEAEAYLDVVASGHDDPLLRASAEKALGELRDRAKRNTPSQPKGTTP
jgi:hypothetical protein